MTWVLVAAAGGLAAAATGIGIAARARGRGRRVWGVTLAVFGAGVLVAGEALPRAVVADSLAHRDPDASVSVSSAPLAWQAITGGVHVSVAMGESGVRERTEEFLKNTPLDGTVVTLEDDVLVLARDLALWQRDLPFEAQVSLYVQDGQIRLPIESVTVRGIPVPQAVGDGGGPRL